MASNISLDDLAALINIVRGSNDSDQKSEEQPKPENESESKSTSDPTPEPAEETEELDSEESAKQDERENRFIDKSLAAQFERNGIHSDVLSSFSEFIDYDKLKTDGEADEEKISNLADLFSGVANRTPPKGSSKKRALDDNGGIAKYLPKD